MIHMKVEEALHGLNALRRYTDIEDESPEWTVDLGQGVDIGRVSDRQENEGEAPTDDSEREGDGEGSRSDGDRGEEDERR